MRAPDRHAVAMTAVVGPTAEPPGPVSLRGAANVRLVGDVTIVVPQGTIDLEVLSRVHDTVQFGATDALLIDLSECVITDLGVRDSLVPGYWGLEPIRFCLVCSRLSGRRLLAKAGLNDRVAVFASTGDARQARSMHRSGYGPGWNPS